VTNSMVLLLSITAVSTSFPADLNSVRQKGDRPSHCLLILSSSTLYFARGLAAVGAEATSSYVHSGSVCSNAGLLEDANR
jgi:hypothetical protein